MVWVCHQQAEGCSCQEAPSALSLRSLPLSSLPARRKATPPAAWRAWPLRRPAPRAQQPAACAGRRSLWRRLPTPPSTAACPSDTPGRPFAWRSPRWHKTPAPSRTPQRSRRTAARFLPAAAQAEAGAGGEGQRQAGNKRSQLGAIRDAAFASMMRIWVDVVRRWACHRQLAQSGWAAVAGRRLACASSTATLLASSSASGRAMPLKPRAPCCLQGAARAGRAECTGPGAGAMATAPVEGCVEAPTIHPLAPHSLGLCPHAVGRGWRACQPIHRALIARGKRLGVQADGGSMPGLN